MPQTTIKCPACGEQATGKFCNNCGGPLTPQNCRSCETTLSASARFCHVCGNPTAARSAEVAKTGNNAGWIAAGVASVALVIAVGMQFIDRGAAGPPGQLPSNVPTPQVRAPDISNMTPRERADRLFERIMIADSRGLADTVAFFTPMALEAYALLGDFDIDARYHVGLIQGLAGNDDAVRAQSDSIRASVPAHLMAPMLDYTLASLQGDTGAMTSAYREFLGNYPSEIGQTRGEYEAHKTALESFRQDAAAASGGAESIQPL